MSLLGFRVEDLRQMKKDLDFYKQKVEFALQQSASLIDIKSSGARERADLEKDTDPEKYFHFRFFDKGVSIIINRYFINEDGSYSRTNEVYYHLAFYNFNPKCFKSKLYELPYVVAKNQYGNFEFLSLAYPYFVRGVVDLIYQCVPSVRPEQGFLQFEEYPEVMF